MTNNHLHGSPKVWKTIFEGKNYTYSETPQTQNQLFELVKLDFLSEIFPKKGSMVEIGCGSAFVSLYFAKRGLTTTCVDINTETLDVAKTNYKQEKKEGTFLIADAEKLPFKDNSFDVVTSFGLIEHFVKPSISIGEMVRVLKPGGLFFADIVPNRFSCQSFGNIFNFFVTLGYWTAKGKPAVGYQKGLRNFRPLYYESKLSWQQYEAIILKAGIPSVTVRGNRPFSRLTLPPSLDRVYAKLIKPFVPFWKKFDRSPRLYPKIWGAGLWFWGIKK